MKAIRLAPTNLQAQKWLGPPSLSNAEITRLLAQVANGAISLHPNYSPAYLWRGTAEANQGQLEQASADFETAVKKTIPANAYCSDRVRATSTQAGSHWRSKKLLLQKSGRPGSKCKRVPWLLLIGGDLGDKKARAGNPPRATADCTRPKTMPRCSPNLAVLQMDMRNYPRRDGERDSRHEA